MALTQHAGDEGIGQRGQVVPVVGQTFGVGQIIGTGFHPVAPVLPAAFAHVRFKQGLFLPRPQDAGHPGEAGRVAVLLVKGQAVLLAGGVEVIDPLAVFGIIRRVDPDDGVDALAAGVDQRGAGQLHLVDGRQLLARLHVVALHEGVAVAGDIGIFPACAVHRVEADPCTDLRVAVAHDLADVAAAGVQLFDELPGSAVPTAF